MRSSSAYIFYLFVTRRSVQSFSNMREDKSVDAALALIAKDKSKILGLSYRTLTSIQPGDFVPKKGQYQALPLIPRSMRL